MVQLPIRFFNSPLSTSKIQQLPWFASEPLESDHIIHIGHLASVHYFLRNYRNLFPVPVAEGECEGAEAPIFGENTKHCLELCW